MHSTVNFLFKGYRYISTLYQSKSYTVYRAFDEKNNCNVILKALSSLNPTLAEIERLKKEFFLLKEFANPYVIEVIDIFAEGHQWVLKMEDIKGVSLAELIKKNSLSIDDFFHIAINLCRAIDAIHRRGLLHKDIKPANILISPEKEIKLIDFSIAQDFSSLQKMKYVDLEGTLEYISPEQSGRFNRIPHRASDLYSLGITLYEMLSGKVPFFSENPLDLIYFHLSKTPPPLYSRIPNTPAILGDVIMKLLEKEPEKRYQTALGLKEDLEYIEKDKESISRANYTLCQHDTPPYLSFPTELYGRKQLIEDFVDKLEEGASYFLVEGYSGIGKSSFIEEGISRLDEPVTLIQGKIEQFQDKNPLTPLLQGLRSFFSKELYFENEPILTEKRAFWSEVLKKDGLILIDHIPELRCIKEHFLKIDKDLSLRDRKDKLFSSLLTILDEIVKHSGRVVIIFDDLQWVDLATLDWLKKALTRNKKFIWIGSYRSNEVNEEHPLARTILDLEKDGVSFHKVFLLPLAKEDIKDFLTDTFGRNPGDNFVRWVQMQSGGNPFFMRQILEYLQNTAQIAYSIEERSWVVDADTVSLSDQEERSVAELMVKTFHLLPEKTRSVLSIAALYGSAGPVNLLKTALNMSKEDFHFALQPAISLGLMEYIVRKNEGVEELYYQFFHDQVQQTAYQELLDEEKENWHKKILESGIPLSIQEKAFHINACSMEELSSKEMEEGIQANIEAGLLAESSSGTQIALNYFVNAERLAKKIWSWEKQFPEMFSLYKNLASAYLKNLESEKAESTFDFLLEKCHVDVILQIKVHTLKIELYTYQDRFFECMRELKVALKRTSIPFSDNISNFSILLKILKIRFQLFFKDFYALKPMKDPWAVALMDLFSASFTALLQVDQKRALVISTECIRLMFSYGYPDQLMGIFLGNFLFFLIKDFSSAKKFYDYVYFLHQDKGVGRDWEAVLTYGGFLVDHWFNPIDVSIEHLKEAYNLSYAKGNYYYRNSAGFLIIAAYFRVCMPISKLDEYLEKMYQILFKEKHWAFAYCSKFLLEGHYLLLDDVKASEKNFNQAIDLTCSLKSKPVMQVVYSSCCLFYYILERWEDAYSFAKKSFSLREINICHVNADQDDLFVFLAFRKKGGHLKERKELKKNLEMWSIQSPENSLGIFQIIEAVEAFDRGEDYICFRKLQSAIQFFEKRSWWLYSAVAKEFLSEVLQEWAFVSMAKKLLEEASYEYGLWNAKAKQNLIRERLHLEERKEHKTDHGTTSSTRSTHSTRSTRATGQIDLMSIVEASQTISEEIKVENLIEKITKLLLKNSGAQRVVLFRKISQTFKIESEGVLDNKEMLVSLEPTESSKIPFSKKLFDWMQRAEEFLVINKNDNIYNKDPYFTEHNVKSAALIPINHQGRMIGYVYFENFKISYAFDENMIQTLQLIIHQAAISLENANLYQTYRKFVPHEFLENLEKHNLSEIALGDQVKKHLTILFIDIRNFTAMAEKCIPEEVFAIIHDFLEATSPAIRSHQGFVDKYIGDAIMGIFPDPPDNALEAALVVVKKLKIFNAEREKTGRPPIDVGIGINTGDVILGVIGESERLETSVFGDTVNIASRIEAMNRLYDTTILITDATKEALIHPEKFSMRFLTKARVKGRKEEIGLWEVFL